MTHLLSNTPLLICLVYLAISLIVGLLPGLSKQDKAASAFVAADGGMNTMLLFFILGAAIFSSLAFLGAPSMSYSRGAAAYALVGGGILGPVLFFLIAPAVRRYGREHGSITQGDFFKHRYNSNALSILLAVFGLVVSAPYLVFQIKGAGLVLQVVSGGAIPFWVGALITYAIVGIYVLVSGVRGVGWTNAIQGLFMACVALFIGWYFPTILFGGVGEMFTLISQSDSSDLLWRAGRAENGADPWSWAMYASTLFIIAAGSTGWPHLFMKSFAANSQSSLRRMATLMPIYALFMLPLLSVGFAVVLQPQPLSSPDTLVPGLLVGSQLPVIIIGVLAAAILAASMSSGDTILHAAGSIVVHDGLKNIIQLSPLAEVRLIRLVIIILLTVCFAIALTSSQSIVQIYLASYGLVAQIFPVTIAACFWSRSTKVAVFTALLGGMLTSAIVMIFPDLQPIPMHEGVYGMAVNVAFLILISLLFPRKRKSPMTACGDGRSTNSIVGESS